MLPLVPTNKEVAMRERKEISKEDVARRAHELTVQAGTGPGKDVTDWVRAENELSGEDFVFEGSVKTKAAPIGHA